MGFATAVSLFSLTMAAAEVTDPPPDDPDAGEPIVAEESEAPAAFDYLPDPGVVLFSLPDEEGDFVDCTEAVITAEEDGSFTVDPPECLAAPAVGPNGQVNHGQIVKAYVRGLKDAGYEGPLGHLVREVAKSDLGKGDQQIKPGDGEDDEPGGAGLAEAGSNGKGKGKEKSKANRGRAGR